MAMNFSTTSCEGQVMKPELRYVNAEPKRSQSSGCTHIRKKKNPKNFNQTFLSARKLITVFSDRKEC
jgi:hypothetical protein